MNQLLKLNNNLKKNVVSCSSKNVPDPRFWSECITNSCRVHPHHHLPLNLFVPIKKKHPIHLQPQYTPLNSKYAWIKTEHTPLKSSVFCMILQYYIVCICFFMCFKFSSFIVLYQDQLIGWMNGTKLNMTTLWDVFRGQPASHWWCYKNFWSCVSSYHRDNRAQNICK